MVGKDKYYLRCTDVSNSGRPDYVSLYVQGYVCRNGDAIAEKKVCIRGVFRKEFVLGNRLEVTLRGISYNTNKAWVLPKPDSGSFDAPKDGFWVDTKDLS